MQKYIIISDEKVIYYDDVKTDLGDIFEKVDRDIKRKWKVDYYNIPVCFDIETSSFYQDSEKKACMYIWMFSIDDNIIIGRTWEDFLFLCNELVKEFSLHWKFRRMTIYVQNLSYEFQWFCRRFKWQKVFALDNRIPLSALTKSGIEFRCSYRLSGYNLEKMGEQLVKYKVQKMVGDLDYDLIRLPADPAQNFAGTPLDDKEMGYCINDVRVLSSYIREKIEHDGGITRIPLTKTGYVRQYCREHIFADHKSKQFKHYRELMQKLTIEPSEYDILREGFQGGFTHANAYHVGKTLHNMWSSDYCSKYPSQMIAKMYPMGKGEKILITDKKTFYNTMKDYCCIFRIRIHNLRPKILYENYLSESKCRNVVKAVVNNGRIVSAECLDTTITNVDFDILKECYLWDSIEIGTFYRYKKGYLPTEFVKCILEFYRIKTELKDLEGLEAEYLQGKENLNSCYGMTVTSIVRDMFTFMDSDDLGEWICETTDKNEVIEKYNNSINRFLFYPWGVFVTAYARYDIWINGILKVKDDYVYSDTDSVKFLHPEKHQDFIQEFNKSIGEDLLKAMRYHGLDPKLLTPKTIEGKEKPLGVYEIDGKYSRFKTLGAKRYLVEDAKTGDIKMTVAGLPKKSGKSYMSKYKDPFKVFTKDMTVPITEAGKQTATYIDYEIEGDISDYMGHVGHFHELSCIHLEPTSYSLSIAGDYVNYLLSINDDFEF